ncbi:DUF3224 domain-containing protein [Virgisporangium aurantiacum]|uniref:DUF3224 domain-containing protein n=1 Tax=Virgisporangium aurantiacum TaxID=175570 RepID=A0A8J3Z4F0_9ACTN|nr:DUF3224 domain-containing protein [Virgisporangium aurantiacum]GIJ54770.1 hypothetical protein Vau01_022860 [Virgisporangium aurantiacum]
MAEQAKATLTIGSWNEGPYQEWDSGAKLVKASVTGTFAGDIEGDGSSEMLMAYRSASSASFTGLQLVDGSVGGRSGRFVIELSGTFEAGTATVAWTVVPGSGTGELAGITGTGGYTAGPGDFPTITVGLDYDL